MSIMDTLHYAFEYQDMGLSTIPVQGKKPAYELLPEVDGKRSWKEYQTRKPTSGELIAWHENLTREKLGYEAGIAIVTGSISGVMAFDIDSLETARRFFIYNKKIPLSAMMTRSREGCGHVYYRLPKGLILDNRVRIKQMGALDIRGEHGYCVAPPSPRADGSGRYERVGNWNLKDVPYFDPAWIEEEEPSPLLVSIPETRGRISNLMNYCRRIPSIQGQGGSTGAFRVACVCRDEGLNSEEALAFMLEWQEQGQVEPKWSDAELRHKIEGAFSVRTGK